MKTLNLRRNPRASLCAITERFWGEWHTVEGDVEIVDLPEAMEPLVEYYRATSGEHPDWNEYRDGDAERGPRAVAHDRRSQRPDQAGLAPPFRAAAAGTGMRPACVLISSPPSIRR